VRRRFAEFSAQKAAREAHWNEQRLARTRLRVSRRPSRAGQSRRQNLPRLARAGHADAGENWADLWHPAATPSVVFAGRWQKALINGDSSPCSRSPLAGSPPRTKRGLYDFARALRERHSPHRERQGAMQFDVDFLPRPSNLRARGGVVTLLKFGCRFVGFHS
jgi:hypothetical protein